MCWVWDFFFLFACLLVASFYIFEFSSVVFFFFLSFAQTHAPNIKVFPLWHFFFFLFFNFPVESGGYCCLLVLGFSMMPKCTELVCVFFFLMAVTNFASQCPLCKKGLEK